MKTAINEIRSNGLIIRLRRARVKHECNQCDSSIEPGERYYEVIVGKGLAAIKFPKRVHERCIEKYTGGER